MIKCEFLGMKELAKNRADITSTSTVNNYSFLTSGGVTYLIDQAVTGDDAHKEGLSFAAGTKLRGFDVTSWLGQRLIVDGKHIVGGVAGLHFEDETTTKTVEKTAAANGSLTSITDSAGTVSDVVVKTTAGVEIAGSFSSGTFTATTSSDIVSGTKYNVTYTLTYSATSILNIDSTTGKLTSGSASGIYFTYDGDTTLTEPAAYFKVTKA